LVFHVKVKHKLLFCVMVLVDWYDLTYKHHNGHVSNISGVHSTPEATEILSQENNFLDLKW